MSGAVMPHEEVSEYLPTQAVAEYLANEVRLDGMIFPSVQAGQKASNVVLFHHASKVEEVKLPRGTRIDSMIELVTSDGVFPHYQVWERIPPSSSTPLDGTTPGPLDFDFPNFALDDSRDDSLQIDLTSIQVLHVDAVRFHFKTHPVPRHRFEEPENDPFDDENPE